LNPAEEDGMEMKQNETTFQIMMTEDCLIEVYELLTAAVLLYVLQKLAAGKEQE